ncbi:ABC transporter ATP-binding protein [Microbacterium natoriense]
MTTPTQAIARIRSRPEDGRWRRFLNIYRSIRVPWLLYAISLLLGILAAQTVLWLAPLSAQIGRGDFTTEILIPSFIGLTVASIAVNTANSVASTYAQFRVTRDVQRLVWAKLLRAPMATIDQQRAPELVSRVTNDPTLASNTLFSLTAFVPSLWGFTGAVIAMSQANGTLSLIFLTMIPVALLTFWVAGRTEFVAQRMLMRAWGTITGFFAERMGMFAALKALGADQAEITAGNGAINTMFKAGVFQQLMISLQVLLGNVVQNAATVIVFVGGAAFVRSGDLSQENLTVFFALVGAAMPFMFEILTQYQMVTGAQGFTEKIGHVLELPQENATAGAAMPAESADIHLRHVSFSYGERSVLRNISVTIPSGRVTAIVGSNGSGKSTLLKLLQRVYEPTSGELVYGETPVSSIALEEWRRRVGTVAQDTALLTGTIRENIAFSDLDAPFALVEDAAAIADARSFIETDPRGYEMPVGEGGEKLSGGQRQRVAIARALLADPTCLLLDEAGSALDRPTDARVDRALRRAMSDRTLVIVSHRPQTIAQADHVIVLCNGEVDAVGTHEELLESCSTYQVLMQGTVRPTGNRSADGHGLAFD